MNESCQTSSSRTSQMTQNELHLIIRSFDNVARCELRPPADPPTTLSREGASNSRSGQHLHTCNTTCLQEGPSGAISLSADLHRHKLSRAPQGLPDALQDLETRRHDGIISHDTASGQRRRHGRVDIFPSHAPGRGEEVAVSTMAGFSTGQDRAQDVKVERRVVDDVADRPFLGHDTVSLRGEIPPVRKRD